MAEERVQKGFARVLWVVLALCAASAALVYAWYYAQGQRDKAQLEVRANTYALCVAQNAARDQTRDVAVATYALVSGALRSGGPVDPELHHIFRQQEKKLAKQLEVLRPLDCSTYVRPSVPPDHGHGVD